MKERCVQISKIRNEQENITTDIKEMQNVMREYLKKFFYSDKLENLQKTAAKPLKLSYNKKINNQNRPIICEEVEIVIKCLHTKKSPDPERFRQEFYQTFKEDWKPDILKTFKI